MTRVSELTKQAEEQGETITQLVQLMDSPGWKTFYKAVQAQLASRRRTYELPAGNGGLDEALNGHAIRMEMQAINTVLAIPNALLEAHRDKQRELLEELEIETEERSEVNRSEFDLSPDDMPMGAP